MAPAGDSAPTPEQPVPAAEPKAGSLDHAMVRRAAAWFYAAEYGYRWWRDIRPGLRHGGVAGAAHPVEGYKWLLLAEKGQYPDSKGIREKTANQVSPQDRRQAEALAQAFVPKLERPVVEDGAGASSRR